MSKKKERIYIINITSDEIIESNDGTTLHKVVCDCQSEDSKHILKDIPKIFSPEDYKNIQEHGFYMAEWDDEEDEVLLKTWKEGHCDECHYTDDDCMQYCLMQLSEHFMGLIDANELLFFDELLERGKSEETDLPINEDLIENEAYKMVYGAMLVNHELMEDEKAMNIAKQMANYGYIYIRPEDALLCQYCTIEFFPELRKCNGLIPFAACMKIPVSLKNRDFSVTLTPVINDKCIWEYMVNRPFLLACRGETIVNDLSYDNFGKHINITDMMEAYNVADLVTGIEDNDYA